MAENAKPLNDLDRLTQDIISKFESALSVSTTSDLTTLVDNINKSLEQQANIIQNINVNSTDHLQKVSEESTLTQGTTSELQKQSKLYGDILSVNDDISENWSDIIKQSATATKNYDSINKNAKKYLATLNIAILQEKKLSDLTVKRLKNSSVKQIPTTSKASNKTGKTKGVAQFLNVDGLISRQISIESLSGGKPYFASHPELGVPMGLFNTKDEPNRSARIRSIKKYGSGGVFGDSLYPQYVGSTDANKITTPTSAPTDAGAATLLIAIKGLEQASKNILGPVAEIVDLANKMAEKIEEYSSKADEAIKSTVRGAGVLMTRHWEDMFAGDTPLTRAAYFQDAIQRAAIELNVDEGVYASFEMLTDLQKSFTEYSKTNVLLGKDDLKNLIYLEHTFDIAASDLGQIQGAFMDLGMSSEDLIKYTSDLATNARDYGVSATQLLKETSKLIKLGSAYRFKGGVKDMEKMQVYAANAKFDIEKAYQTMDKTMSIEGAVDMAAQLQTLGGSFSDISSLDLFSASVSGDWESFTKNIIGRFQQDSGRFGQINKEGMFQFSNQGRLLLKAFKNVEGLDIGENLEDVLTKAGKEAEVRKQLLAGVNKNQFMTLPQDQQDKAVKNIAMGSVKSLNLTGLSLMNYKIDFATTVFDNAADKTVKVGQQTALGGMSVKDRQDLNQQLIAIQSQTRGAFDGVSTALESLKPYLLLAGDTIQDVGLSAMKTPFYRVMKIMTESLDLSTEEAVLMNKWFISSTPGDNKLAGGIKGIFGYAESIATAIGQIATVPGTMISGFQSVIKKLTGVANPVSTAITNQGTGVSSTPSISNPLTNIQQANGVGGHWNIQHYGGLLKADGGMVIGPSHMSGGVPGTGQFNNVVVEGGEAIINKRSTEMFLPLLSKLNELGGGTPFSSGGDKMFSNTTPGDSTINIKINGKLDYKSGIINPSVDIYELAEDIQNATSGKSYGGVY